MRRRILHWFLAFTVLSMLPGLSAAPKVKLDPNPIKAQVKSETSYAPIVRQVSPSVVSVYSTRAVKELQELDPGQGDLFEYFFGPQFRNRIPGNRMPAPREERGLGSGVIVSEDGYILTNNHVVENADEVEVVLPNSRERLRAKVVGTDPLTDIAVIKVERRNLPAITFTDSERIEVGDAVLAIGYPFGVGQTVTSGIVSALGRGGLGIVRYEDFIQTDAPINRGNSGGALVDAEGRLVGINTLIISPSGVSSGIGFAVPSNMARFVMERIIDGGRVSRGYLGLYPQAITPELARAFDLKEARGALVADVVAGEPADKAGIRVNDVILEFNGKPVTDDRQLRLLAAQSAPGSKVPVRVLRDGRERTLTVTLGELPVEMTGTPSQPRRGGNRPDEAAILGLQLVDLTPRVRDQAQVTESIRGAFVMRVMPGSRAEEAGVMPGDVITEVNRKPVENSRQAIQHIENARDQEALLRLWRRQEGEGSGFYRYAVLKTGER